MVEQTAQLRRQGRRVAGRHEKAGLVVLDQLRHPARRRGDHRLAEQHALEDDAPEGLGPDRGVDDDVPGVHHVGNVGAEPGEVHAPAQPQLGDARPQVRRIALAGTVGAAGDDAVHLGVIGEQAQRLDEHALALPFLDVAGDADARRPGRHAELAAHVDGIALRAQPGLVDRVVDDVFDRRAHAVAMAGVEHRLRHAQQDRVRRAQRSRAAYFSNSLTWQTTGTPVRIPARMPSKLARTPLPRWITSARSRRMMRASASAAGSSSASSRAVMRPLCSSWRTTPNRLTFR
ncbi:MAG: hypothetical protein U0802_20705 [Candidatus Binatia bacterium]